MKRKLLILSVLAICIATLAGGSWAYFTASETAHNVITSANVDIDLMEKIPNDDGSLSDFPTNGITGVMPGTDVDKIVYVDNVGDGRAWIRVKTEISIVSSDGRPLPTEVSIGNNTISVVTPNTLSGWSKHTDGYYYYRSSVNPGSSTERFIETVSIASQAGNEYQNCTVYLTVTAQAVQTANNDTDPKSAQGWPS